MARSTLDDFVIAGQLGTGSFGTVYKVTRKADQQQYALKMIDLRSMSEQEQEDCIKECSVLAALDSPYIIKFFDSFFHKVGFRLLPRAYVHTGCSALTIMQLAGAAGAAAVSRV
jgi:serine/threonine protein kinase